MTRFQLPWRAAPAILAAPAAPTITHLPAGGPATSDRAALAGIEEGMGYYFTTYLKGTILKQHDERIRWMGRRLRQLEKRYREVLFVCSLLDWPWVRDAYQRNLGDAPNAHVLQADLRDLPFAPRSIEYLYCIGVLQHTPDPLASARGLVELLAPGGRSSPRRALTRCARDRAAGLPPGRAGRILPGPVPVLGRRRAPGQPPGAPCGERHREDGGRGAGSRRPLYVSRRRHRT